MGELMDSASVFAVPARGQDHATVGQVLTPGPLLPARRPGVLRDGAFSIGIDPGEFDFSVPPGARLRLPVARQAAPWRPEILCDGPPRSPDLELAAISFPAGTPGRRPRRVGRAGSATPRSWPGCRSRARQRRRRGRHPDRRDPVGGR